MDQVVNHAAKWRYMSGGQVSVPLVIRGPISNGIGHGRAALADASSRGSCTRRASIVADAGDAVRREGPAEGGDPRGQPGRLPREAPALRAGRARCRSRSTSSRSACADVKRAGTDVTVVAAGATVPLALQAARQLAREGIELEVIDVRHAQAARRRHDRRSRSRRPAGSWSSTRAAHRRLRERGRGARGRSGGSARSARRRRA